ncbi:MAG: hypothetical protein ACLFQB_16240 [Chitinispirillaceae bacterium]
MQKMLIFAILMISVALNESFGDGFTSTDTLTLNQGIVFGSTETGTGHTDFYFYQGESCLALCCSPALMVGSPTAIYRSRNSREYYDFKNELDLDDRSLFERGSFSGDDGMESIKTDLFAESGCFSERKLFEDKFYVIITPDSNYVISEIRYIPVMCYDAGTGCPANQNWVEEVRIEVSWEMGEEKSPRFPSLVPLAAAPRSQQARRTNQVLKIRTADQAYTLTGQRIQPGATVSKHNVLIIRDTQGSSKRVLGKYWQNSFKQ